MNDFNEAHPAPETEAVDAAQGTETKSPPGDKTGLIVTWGRLKTGRVIGKYLENADDEELKTEPFSRFWLFETVEYDSLDAFLDDVWKRMEKRRWSMVEGRLQSGLNPREAHERVALRVLVAKRSAFFFIDLDDFLPQSPSLAHGDRLRDAAAGIRDNILGGAFAGKRCGVMATSSTGLAGEGKVRIRLVFVLSEPKTGAWKKTVAAGLKKNPRLADAPRTTKKGEPVLDKNGKPKFHEVTDTTIYEPTKPLFVSRPRLPIGVFDPVPPRDWAFVLNGDPEPVDVNAFDVGGSGVGTEDAGDEDPGDEDVGVGDENRDKDDAPGPTSDRDPPEHLEMPVKEPMREAIIVKIGRSLRNDLERNKYAGLGHMIRGACGGAHYGRDCFLEVAGRYENGSDPKEDERVYDTLSGTGTGWRELVQLAETNGGAAGLDAIQMLYMELFPPLANDNAPDARDAALTRDERFRQALQFDVSIAPGVRRTRDFDRGPEGFISFGANYLPTEGTVRPLLSPWLMRGVVTAKIAWPGAGKTTGLILMAVAIAAERPDIIGLKPGDLKRLGDCVLVCNEDAVENVHDQILATLKAHDLAAADLKHTIHVEPSPLTFVQGSGARGAPEPTDEAIRLAKRLARHRERVEIAYLGLDTLLSLAGGADLNGTAGMGPVLNMARDARRAIGCSVEVLHHFSKAGGKNAPEDMTSALGSMALPILVRAATHMVRVSDEEGASYGWTPAETERRVKMIFPKTSYKAKGGDALFFEWKSITITALDLDDPSQLAVEDMGVLIPIPAPTVKHVLPEEAHRVLWEAHKRGVKIRRGSAKGPQPADAAHNLLESALGI
jgi:hypothetical protein